MSILVSYPSLEYIIAGLLEKDFDYKEIAYALLYKEIGFQNDSYDKELERKYMEINSTIETIIRNYQQENTIFKIEKYSTNQDSDSESYSDSDSSGKMDISDVSDDESTS
jgi:hypothetical protein